jgi:hypothetical protein
MGQGLAFQAGYLVFGVQNAEVVLKGVGHVAVLDPNEGDAFDGGPDFRPGPHGVLQQLIKVFVMAEDDMPA